MNIQAEKLTKKDLLWWGILFVAEIIILFMGITHEGVWYDESCSVGIINHPLSEIWEVVKGDVHPPLYFYLLKLFTLIFGKSVLAMRSFSVLGVLGLFILGIGPVRRACGKGVGLLFSFMVMMLPIYLAYAQEIRMYSWAVFFVTGSLLYVYLAIAEGKTSDWIKFGVFMLAAMYTHYYSLLGMMVLCGLILIWFLFAAKNQKKWIFYTIIGMAILSYMPWILSLLGQVRGISNDYWIAPVSFYTIWETLVAPFDYKFHLTDPLSVSSFYLAAGLILWGIGYALFGPENATERPRARVIYLAVIVYVLTLTAAAVFSFLFWPILFPRHMLPLSGLLVLAVAYGLAKLPSKKLIPVFGLLFLILMIPHAIKIYQGQFNGPIKEISSFFKDNLNPKDVFIHTGEIPWGTFSIHFPHNQHFFYLSEEKAGFANCKTFENGSAGTDLSPFLSDHPSKTLWLVDDKEITRDNPVVKIFGAQSVMDVQLFATTDSWMQVYVCKIKLE